MKFTISWLKEYLNTDASLDQITDKLTAIGLEVEEVVDNSAKFQPFIAAEILSAKPHPDADKLQICEVSDGTKNLQIVCGASNARAGIKVILAPVGVVIPTNGMKIKKSKIRGVESNGMLCSSDELGIGADAKGIMELPGDVVIGQGFASQIGLDDPMIEIAITPNRGDCLGVYGIARDLAAAGIGELISDKFTLLTSKEGEDDDPTSAEETCDANETKDCIYNFPQLLDDGIFDSPIKVKISDDNCSFFIGRTFRNVKNGPSPDWLRRRLESIEVKSHSILVDITNYLTFAFGRPAHIYDADKLIGNLDVRPANDGQKIATLDDNEHILSGDMLVIADDKSPVALAGIIGGSDSSVQDDTNNIFLEMALFEPINIAKTGRKLQIETDSRYRFERGVSASTLQHFITASQMIEELAAGDNFAISKPVVAGSIPTQHHQISFDTRKIQKLLGIEIAHDKVVAILNNLGFDVDSPSSLSPAALISSPPPPAGGVGGGVDQTPEHQRAESRKESCQPSTANRKLSSNTPPPTPPAGGGGEKIVSISIPSFRPDIASDVDIIEEIARIYGYDNIPSIALPVIDKDNIISSANKLNECKQKLVARGLKEAVTFSFISEIDAQYFTDKKLVKIANPISSDLNVMRPSILPNLVNAVKNNYARGVDNIALFEAASIFSSDATGDQQLMIAAVHVGKTSARDHYNEARDIDVFDVKSSALAALSPYNITENKVSISAENLPKYYHPGKSGAIMQGKNLLAYFGELHPSICKKMDVVKKGKAGNSVNIFEVFVDNISPPRAKKTFARKKLNISNYQAVERDFAFVLSDDISSAQLINAVKKADKKLINKVSIFDIYKGDGLEEGKKSVAISVRLQPIDKTLEDAEITQISDKIIDNVVKNLGASLR